MIGVAALATVMIAGAALCALIRINDGPTMADRAVAFDLLTTVLVAAIAIEAWWSRRVDSIPILVVLALVGFLGSVVIAKYAVDPADHLRQSGRGRKAGDRHV